MCSASDFSGNPWSTLYAHFYIQLFTSGHDQLTLSQHKIPLKRQIEMMLIGGRYGTKTLSLFIIPWRIIATAYHKDTFT